MAAATFPNRVVEYFTLRETEREARSLPDDVRALTGELALSFQKREAAETLWPRGSMAEALKLARAALETASASLDTLGARDNPPGWVTAAQALTSETMRRTAGAPSPALEKDIQPSAEDTFRTIVDALIVLEEQTGRRLAGPGDVTALRRRRVLASALLTAFAVALAAWAFHSPMFLKATGSSQFGEYGAENAIDGDPKTVWILPSAPGWIDLTLGRTRTVSALRVVPGNPPWNDRDAKEVHIEAFLNNAVVKAIDFTFRDPPGSEPDWQTVPFGAPRCDRIRITVKSNYKLSPAIAEIEIK